MLKHIDTYGRHSCPKLTSKAPVSSTTSQSNSTLSNWRCRDVGRNVRPHRAFAVRQAGPLDPSPDYKDIDSQPLNRLIMALFRRKMSDALGKDTSTQGYDAIVELTRDLNSKFASPRDTQLATRRILNSLFPSWLPGAFKVMFSKPLPEFSSRLNAFATAATCQWLMGPCKVNDVELENGQIAKGMGVKVERCRYLESTGCASVCINSCKVPTQEFFAKDMGLPLTMTPNYEDFSCQFSFGKVPLPLDQDDAFKTPCFQQCPSKRRHTAVDLQQDDNCLDLAAVAID